MLCSGGGYAQDAKGGVAAKPPAKGSCGRPLSYREVPVHRLIKHFVLQAGDLAMGNGTGGECAVNNGKPFKDDVKGVKVEFFFVFFNVKGVKLKVE